MGLGDNRHRTTQSTPKRKAEQIVIHKLWTKQNLKARSDIILLISESNQKHMNSVYMLFALLSKDQSMKQNRSGIFA